MVIFNNFADMKNLVLLSLLVLLSCKQNQSTQEDSQTVIAFGSCSDQKRETQLWSEIATTDPELFILLGDNVYADTHDMSEMADIYLKQKSDTNYQKLLAKTEVIGTWDDHDYGVNDGGRYYTKKDSSKLLLLDFLDVPMDAEVRSHEGVYSSHTLNDSGHQIKVILLDTRYARDTLMPDTSSNQRYQVNTTGKILSEKQWLWLENELTNSTANVNIIGSSIQVIAEEHPFEKWANFPQERQRLLDLIASAKAKNTIMISGDRHIAELSSIELNGKTLYDFTSSGLSHTWNEIWEEPNQHRIKELIIARNFGLITIDWHNETMNLQVRGENNEVLLSHEIKLNDR